MEDYHLDTDRSAGRAHQHCLWHCNSRILAIASADNTARLWNVDNSHPISSPLYCHDTCTVTCVSFSADGKLLATGCDVTKTHIQCWEVRAIITSTVSIINNRSAADTPVLDSAGSLHFLFPIAASMFLSFFPHITTLLAFQF